MGHREPVRVLNRGMAWSYVVRQQYSGWGNTVTPALCPKLGSLAAEPETRILFQGVRLAVLSGEGEQGEQDTAGKKCNHVVLVGTSFSRILDPRGSSEHKLLLRVGARGPGFCPPYPRH